MAGWITCIQQVQAGLGAGLVLGVHRRLHPGWQVDAEPHVVEGQAPARTDIRTLQLAVNTAPVVAVVAVVASQTAT